MKRRKIALIVVGTFVLIIGGAWGFQLAYDWAQPNPSGLGWTDEGKPWNASKVGEPFEGGRLIAMQRHEMVAKDTYEYTWPVQVLIVFPRESTAEIRGQGKNAGPRFAAPRWRYRFADGIERTSSISIQTDDEVETVQIEARDFRLQSGNLFCVLLDRDLEFSKVMQLNETMLATKATIADFKRDLPDVPDVQAIREY